MRNFAQLALLTAFLLAAVAEVSFAGAWTAKEEKLYERIAINYYAADQRFDRDGDRIAFADKGKFSDYNLSNYLEYGLTDEVTLINAIAFKRIQNDSAAERLTTWGVGDIDLGIRYKLLENRLGIFSTQGLVKIPEAYDADERLPLGNGQYDLEAKILYGRSLWPVIPGYTNVELGYRWRDQAPSDEIRYLVEFGVDLGKQFYSRVKLDGIYSLDNGETIDDSGNPTSTNNFDLGKLDLTVGYKLTPAWGVEVAYAPSLYGQNTAAGATCTVALFYTTP